MNTSSQDMKSGFKQGMCRTVTRRSRTWRNTRADLVERSGLKKEETSFNSKRHLVLLNLKGASEEGEYFIDGKNAGFVPRKPGALLFVPAGCHWSGWEVGAATAAYLSISVDPAFVSQLISQSPTQVLPSLVPDLGFEDPIIMNAARAIGTEIDDRNPAGTMLIEGYVTTIFAQLMRKRSYTQTPKKGGLAPALLNRVIDRIENQLTTNLSLTDLASMAGFSVPHFCRAFRQSTGCSPYAFLIRRRIERAKDHLRQTAMTITEIALFSGFSDSSHFSNIFRREVGMTPLAYRASWPSKASE
ncbi:hypothetical protein GCM10010924_52620 [Rhizobium wenxiniae]|uniref:AraC-like DNA-binding protein n=1 Tax=Rhizobium wenxiniae TaxID=1737357 RepID=A0A7X0D2I3_9HYPH|nr:AraC family transcriptional regulator [Rhizobium wenxiniae]MBB6165640.1 AraC-like DNA-binding protein [Rhizobium wenxiniae]GGG17066.1 hypothetical protein GCM10010924_52620 [Rhizobium wenxiniae]